jgi:hypothetical protein
MVKGEMSNIKQSRYMTKTVFFLLLNYKEITNSKKKGFRRVS